MAFAGYASRFVPFPQWAIAAALAAAVGGLNVLGANEASWANIGFTLVEASGLIPLIVAAASVALLEPARLAASPSPLAEAMQAGAPRLAGALASVALFATANTALIAVMAASRLLFAMARGGDAPSLLARTMARRQTPAIAILLVVIGAFACIPLGNVGLVGSIASLLALVTFAAVNAALLRLRFTHPKAMRPFRVPLPLGRAPAPTMVGLAVTTLLLAGFEPPVYGIAGVALALAFVVQAIPWQRDPTSRELS